MLTSLVVSQLAGMASPVLKSRVMGCAGGFTALSLGWFMCADNPLIEAALLMGISDADAAAMRWLALRLGRCWTGWRAANDAILVCGGATLVGLVMC